MKITANIHIMYYVYDTIYHKIYVLHYIRLLFLVCVSVTRTHVVQAYQLVTVK